MTTKIIRIMVGMAFITIVMWSSCTYETLPILEVPEVVSFQGDIIPVFNSSCSLSSCHDGGTQRPDLTEANAWNSLVNGNYINIADPPSSRLYRKIIPSGSMSQYFKPNNPELILRWIEQGANNN